MSKVYWEDLQPGYEIPSLVKQPISKTQISQFAGAIEDYSPMHLDDQSAKDAGFGGAYAHSVMALGIADEALRRFAKNMRITHISATFQKLVWPGDKITAKGRITKCYKKEGVALIDLELSAENQEHVEVMTGRATCVLWENAKKEKASRLAFPSVSRSHAAELGGKCRALVRDVT